MINVKYKTGRNFIYESLCISEERSNELDHRIALIWHEYFRPTKEGKLPSTDTPLKQAIALAENAQELVYVSYFIGMKTEEYLGEAWHQEEIDDFE